MIKMIKIKNSKIVWNEWGIIAINIKKWLSNIKKKVEWMQNIICLKYYGYWKDEDSKQSNKRWR